MKNFRLLYFFFGLLLLIYIGIYKEIWLDHWAENLVQKFSGNKEQGSAEIMDFLLNNRKFLATTLMSILYFAICSITIFLFSSSKFWTALSCSVYASLMCISLLVYLFGIKANEPQLWWKTAQDIKMLIQSPFILIILSGAFYWFRQQKDN